MQLGRHFTWIAQDGDRRKCVPYHIQLFPDRQLQACLHITVRELACVPRVIQEQGRISQLQSSKRKCLKRECDLPSGDAFIGPFHNSFHGCTFLPVDGGNLPKLTVLKKSATGSGNSSSTAGGFGEDDLDVAVDELGDESTAGLSEEFDEICLWERVSALHVHRAPLFTYSLIC